MIRHAAVQLGCLFFDGFVEEGVHPVRAHGLLVVMASGLLVRAVVPRARLVFQIAFASGPGVLVQSTNFEVPQRTRALADTLFSLLSRRNRAFSNW